MKKGKKAIKVVGIVLLAVVVIVVGYFAYVLIDYHRVGDQLGLEHFNSDNGREQMKTNITYKIISYNIGFGAYESDFGFFMDGGTEAWGWSKDRVEANVYNIGKYLNSQNADFYLVQEVDTDSTRSYHIDESKLLREQIVYPSFWAINYDSPFLFYPFTQPHGKSVSGIMTFSDYRVSECMRKELPIEKSLMKLVDLDRCYSKTYIAVNNDKYLVLYNLHLSAYTSDGTIATEQLKVLLEDMQSEFDNGNYVVGGGDFNKDLLGNASEIFGAPDKEYSWAQPIPEGFFDDYDISLVVPYNEENPAPSCRNADGPYHEGQYVLTVDGFLVSSNVEVIESDVNDLQFEYSDHNPVYMSFSLIEE